MPRKKGRLDAPLLCSCRIPDTNRFNSKKLRGYPDYWSVRVSRDGRVGLDRNAQRIRQTLQLKNCARPGLPIPSAIYFRVSNISSFQFSVFQVLLPAPCSPKDGSAVADI